MNNNKALSLMVGAVGIVYGDIGTSPLYALKSCFSLANIPLNEASILGVISLIIWLLIIVINIKYIAIITRCHQREEGGVLVLSSLCSKLQIGKFRKFAVALGIIGIGLFAGDSIITPAISVLSSLEGLKLVTDISEGTIVILSVLVLLALFTVQSKGSGNIGCYFGYIMLVWFTVIALLGILSIIKNPTILLAINPYYAIQFIFKNGFAAILTIGGAILVITGAEALYADMGHFGRENIKKTWMFFVWPALTSNYLGQGALLLENHQAISHPFYSLVPHTLIYPMVFLSLMATIIASQAVISGLFSLGWQAIMLNYLPKMEVVHTSFSKIGQIYIPAINYILMLLTIIAVVSFRTSDSLAFAYGLSVAGVMLISTLLTILVAYHHWKWSLFKMLLIFIPLLTLDCVFVLSNLAKIPQGAWYTLIIAGVVIYIIWVWIKGKQALKHQSKSIHQDVHSYLQEHSKQYQTRIPGTAIFMGKSTAKIPKSLEIQLNYSKYLPEKLILLSVTTEEVANVPTSDKYSIAEILPNIYSIKASFGFKEVPDLNQIITWAKSKKILEPKEDISFFFSRGLPMATQDSYLNGFSERLYIFLAKNALPAYEFFKINHYNVIELGIRYKV